MKKYIYSLMLILFFACSKTTEKKESENNIDEEKPYFAIISKGWQHQFWQAVKMGAFEAAKDYNVEITFEGPEGDFAIAQQKNMLENVLRKHPKAIILAATDSREILPIVEKINNMNIPIITFDSGIESDIPISSVTTNNKEAASYAAEKIAEAINFEGEIAIVAHDNNSETGSDRIKGFSEKIIESYPNIRIVEVVLGLGEHDLTSDLVSKLLKKYPKLKGIFATNEGSAIGTLNSIVQNKREKNIVIVGFDAGLQQKTAISQGIMLGAISQNPIDIGYKAVEAAYKSYKKEPIPKKIYTEYIWYDSTNVNNPDLGAILYD